MKTLLNSLIFSLTVLTALDAHAGPWFACGAINQIDPTTLQIPGRSPITYEYGISYNTPNPIPVNVQTWNVGVRISNVDPYLINNDNPSLPHNFGGFMFYRNTNAADDNFCSSVGGYHHRYWYLGANNAVIPWASNGCQTVLPVYCRTR
jgi:hypothetical protein